MARYIASTILLLFMLAGTASPMIFRTPEEIAEEFFRSWRLQNQTYMESRMVGGAGLTSFGRLMSKQYLVDYTIEWSDIYRGINIMKIATKLKSVEYGLHKRNFYFYFTKDSGTWKILNGYQVKQDLSAREAYNFFIWANSL